MAESKIVPVEPDEAMQIAGAEQIKNTTTINQLWTMRKVWDAMIALCPDAPDAENYVAWLRYRHNDNRQWIALCGSDDEGAFKVYRHAAPSAAELEGLRRDAELLDWLAHQDFDCLSFSLVVDRPHDGEVELCWTDNSNNERTVYGKTLRGAIDAAIANEGGQHE